MALVRAHILPTAESDNGSRFSVERTMPVTISEIRGHITDLNEFYERYAVISIQIAAVDPHTFERIELPEWALNDAAEPDDARSLFDLSAFGPEE